MTAPNRAAMKVSVFLTDFSLDVEMNVRKLSRYRCRNGKSAYPFRTCNRKISLTAHIPEHQLQIAGSPPTSWQVSCQTSPERYKLVNRAFLAKEGLSSIERAMSAAAYQAPAAAFRVRLRSGRSGQLAIRSVLDYGRIAAHRGYTPS